ncbi:MAG: N-acetylmuramoyl-L-alanine amidase [bacterium]
MKTIYPYLGIFFVLIFITFIFRQIVSVEWEIVNSNKASVFFAESTNMDTLVGKYLNALSNGVKIKILVVPGHEPDFGGAEYGSLKEREINLFLAKSLAEYLKSNPRFEVSFTRDDSGWNSDLEKYFKDKWDEIATWRIDKKAVMNKLVSDGKVQKVGSPYHNNAPEKVAIRLYGINKWANENKFDIILHVHFNDVPLAVRRTGDYSGFSVYVPEKQFSNANASQVLGRSVFNRLSTYGAKSNLPIESAGVIEDQDLVAVGSFNTVDGASILTEYGYIYESQYRNKEIRNALLDEYAYQTFLGVQSFFGETVPSSVKADTTLLADKFSEKITSKSKPSKEALSLQIALEKLGYYPPAKEERNDCPLTGSFGPCTEKAVTAFQKANDIKGESGVFGEKTRDVLNSLIFN